MYFQIYIFIETYPSYTFKVLQYFNKHISIFVGHVFIFIEGPFIIIFLWMRFLIKNYIYYTHY